MTDPKTTPAQPIYLERITTVIDYIGAHLTEDLPLEVLAEQLDTWGAEQQLRPRRLPGPGPQRHARERVMLALPREHLGR